MRGSNSGSSEGSGSRSGNRRGDKKRSGAGPRKSAHYKTGHSSKKRPSSKRPARKRANRSESPQNESRTGSRPNSSSQRKRPTKKQGKRGGNQPHQKEVRDNRSLEQRFASLLEDRSYRPRNKSELAKVLSITPKQRPELREIIKKFINEGKIEGGKHGRYRKAGTLSDREKARRDPSGQVRKRNYKKGLSRKTKAITAKGKLYVGRGGEVYFEPEEVRGDPVELFVAQRDRGSALPGDMVLAEIKEGPVPPHWRRIPSRRWMVRHCEESGEPCRWATVIRVTKRSEKGVVGTYESGGRYHYIVPDASALPGAIDISPADVKKHGAQIGDKLVVLVEGWDRGQRNPHGHILKRLGQEGEAGVDILSIFYKHGLRADFPEAVSQEAAAIPGKVTPADLNNPAGREDWRDELIITVDPADARDFDDAISVKKLDDGGWQLAVHIADVSHYVQPGSPLDKEAIVRGNSTYLADRVVPMLPEKLSNGLCSLVEGEDRLTGCVVIEFDKKGKRGKFRFCKAVIHSAKRLSYEQAMEKLEQPDLKNPVDALLVESWALASVLRERRFKNGALDLEMPEIRAVLDKQGVPIELKRSVHDDSHQLIEEFMLAANETVALHLKREGRPAIYRVHDDPDPEKLFELRELLATFGIKVGDLTNRVELQRALDEGAKMPESHAIKLSVLKSLKRAAYGIDPLGHFGLACADYTHFTSPIRRYADLLVHRSLFADLLVDSKGKKAKTPSYADLTKHAAHLSRTERASGAAEMESQKLKQLEFFTNILKKHPNTSFPGVVTDIQRMGVFVELDDSMLRGLVRPSDLPQDMQRLDPVRSTYGTGSKGRKLSMGDAVKVKIIRVDTESMRVDFSLREWS